MGMARHHHLESPCYRINVKLSEIVNDIDENSSRFQNFRLGDLLGPSAFVVIAANRRDWRDRGQLLQNRLISDVASMDDEVTPMQELDRFNSKKTVSVRDEPNTNAVSRAHSTYFAQRRG
jgi:hypothetical protein